MDGSEITGVSTWCSAVKRVPSFRINPYFFSWKSLATQHPSIYETWGCLEMGGYPGYRSFETHVIEITPEMPLPQAAVLTGKKNQKQRARKGKEVAQLKAEPRFLDTKRFAEDHAGNVPWCLSCNVQNFMGEWQWINVNHISLEWRIGLQQYLDLCLDGTCAGYPGTSIWCWNVQVLLELARCARYLPLPTVTLAREHQGRDQSWGLSNLSWHHIWSIYG